MIRRNDAKLANCAEEGDFLALESLLKDGTRISNNVFFHFVHEGNAKVVDFLLRHGAKPNIYNYRNKTPLLEAIDYWSEEIVEILLSNGANPNWEDDIDGTTPLIAAIQKENFKIVCKLLNRGAGIDVSDDYGQSPLRIALCRKGPSIVLELLRRGANMYASPIIESCFWRKHVLHEYGWVYRGMFLHRLICDNVLALCFLDFSPYILLWIINWIPFAKESTTNMSEKEKFDLILRILGSCNTSINKIN